jgi:hypothetical protein
VIRDTTSDSQWQALISADEEAPFWLVWNPQGHAPTFRHPNVQAAKKEAERLAAINPGQKFHVLEAKALCVNSSVRWVQVDPDWIPF